MVIAVFLSGIILGIFLIYSGIKKIKIVRRIENIPTSKIRSIAIGLVEIYGKAKIFDKPLKGPLSEKECVYYDILIESNHGTIFYANSEEKFYVKDDTGKILIDPKSAKINITSGKEYEAFYWTTPPEGVIRILKEQGRDYVFLMREKNIRYIERRISPLDNIYVMGTATINKENIPKSKGSENLVIKRSYTDNILNISSQSEKNIITDLRYKIKREISVGIVITIICTFSLIAELLKIYRG